MEEPHSQERLEKGMNAIRSYGNDSELWLVRGDGVKRAFKFKPAGRVWIGNGMIKFFNGEMEEEIAVDENEKSGRPPAGKLDFSR